MLSNYLEKKSATVSSIRKFPQVFLIKAKKRHKRAKHLTGKKKTGVLLDKKIKKW